MKSGSPIESLAAAFYRAVLHDLSPVHDPEIKWDFDKKENRTVKIDTGKTIERRPQAHECSVVMFEQTWSSTALGFGGIGGQAMTSAYTVIVEGPMGDSCVYFAGRLAYHIKRPNSQFHADMASRYMKSRRDAAYETKEAA